MKNLLPILILLIAFTSCSGKSEPKTSVHNPSPYGINTSSGRPFWIKKHELKHQPRFAALLGEAGVKWIRIWPNWSLIEPKNDQWDETHLQKVESLLRALQNEGISVSVVLAKIPDWAHKPRYPPDDLKEWDEFVRVIANRFAGDLVQAWEILNEVGAGEGYVERKEVYPEMVRRAANIIRRKDPEAIILPCGFVPVEKTRQMITYWLKEVGPFVDILNVHRYGSDDDIKQAIRLFKICADEAGVGNKPIWLTETNINRLHDPLLEDPPDGGERLQSLFQTALDEGVEKVFWFALTPGIWGPSILEGPWETESGEFEPHEPMYSAYKKMATDK